MRIYLHIGLEHVGANRLQAVLADKRAQLEHRRVLYPRAPGGKNHTRLFMAVSDPDHVDPLRYNRGFITAEKQQALREMLIADLTREVAQAKPETLILSASQLGASLYRASELERLKGILSPLSDDIRIIAHVDEQARLLARHYGAQIMEGRAAPLTRELDLTKQENWWQACLDAAPQIDPQAGQFLETQAPPFWLDYGALIQFWEGAFGAGTVSLRPYNAEAFASDAIMDEIRDAFGIVGTLGKTGDARIAGQPGAAWLARGRQLNELILKVLKDRKRVLPRQLWRSFISEISIPGDAIPPSSLYPVSQRFAQANAKLPGAHPALNKDIFDTPSAGPDWTEADPEMGFRASQYMLAFMYRIDRATKAERGGKIADLAKVATPPDAAAGSPATNAPPAGAAKKNVLSVTARKLLPPQAIQNFENLKSSPFAPHNRLGLVNEEELAAAYDIVPPRQLPVGSSGNVIVGCMKDEAPYIIEWVAYHRAIGVDKFLIYTNGCSDGTNQILDRLQEMGVVEHRDNDNWKGNSPQQHALNKSLKEPVIRAAEWIAHIDVDEFINVRIGNGTLQDFFDATPEATNVAMTWRLFGHNDITQLADKFVIDQFDTCAPKYCPKPHTVWGFKTMFKNIGAYEKISCHRPNKLDEGYRDIVKWVNGSGKDITNEAAESGWRSSKKSIGYDLIQLNHYALRSAESFLIKRQRGRALHVDRSIGINYWIRMDWSDYRDITIKRNLPRLRLEYDQLMADDTLRALHEKGLNWHRSKAEELHGTPEFEDLYQQALKVKLTETERVAYALALDMES